MHWNPQTVLSIEDRVLNTNVAWKASSRALKKKWCKRIEIDHVVSNIVDSQMSKNNKTNTRYDSSVGARYSDRVGKNIVTAFVSVESI